MQKLYLPDHQANEAATSVILTDNGRQRYLLTGKNGLRSNHLEVQNIQGTVLAAAHQLGGACVPNINSLTTSNPLEPLLSHLGSCPKSAMLVVLTGLSLVTL